MADPSEVIAEALDEMLSDIDVIGRSEWLLENADALIGRLRAAGLLLDPGATTNHRWKVEWYETWPGEPRRRRRTRVVSTEAEADNWLKQCEPSETPLKLVRTIHTGPWQVHP